LISNYILDGKNRFYPTLPFYESFFIKETTTKLVGLSRYLKFHYKKQILLRMQKKDVIFRKFSLT